MRITLYFIIIFAFFSCNNKITSSNGFEILNATELKPHNEINNFMLMVDFGQVNGNQSISRVIRIRNLNKEDVIFKQINSDEIKLERTETAIKQNEIRDLKLTIQPNYIEGNSYSMVTIPEKNGKSLTFGFKYETQAKTVKYQIEKDTILLNESENVYFCEIKNIGDIAFNIVTVKSENQDIKLDYSKKDIKINEIGSIKIEYPNKHPKNKNGSNYYN